jgi:hypothetical protein
MVLRQARGARADQVSELGRNLKQHGRHARERVSPNVPGGHEPHEIAIGFSRPDVQAALERHVPVQVIDRHRHRRIEKGKGEQPDDQLCPADPGSDPDPGAAHDDQHLRKDEIAQAQLLPQGTAVGQGKVLLRHRIVASPSL